MNFDINCFKKYWTLDFLWAFYKKSKKWPLWAKIFCGHISRIYNTLFGITSNNFDSKDIIFSEKSLNIKIYENNDDWYKCDATSGQVVAGGNGLGNRNDQLNFPQHVIVDNETDSLIITDRENRRVMRWYQRRSHHL